MLKKIFISTLLFIVLFTQTMLPFSVAKANAQWYTPSFGDWYTKVYDTNSSPETEIFGERYTAAQVNWVVYGLISFLLNFTTNGDPSLWTCIMTREASTCVDFIRTISLTYDTSSNTMLAQEEEWSWINELTSRPISGVAYFKDVGTKLHLIPEAKAQGFGFTAGGSVLELWRISRNITYALMVVAILIMAFMIMFRVKISPQTVITVQSALPKVVISLILITFSYAIAGFLIDLMYVVIGLIAALLVNSIATTDWSVMFRTLTSNDVFQLMTFYLIYFNVMLIPATITGGFFAGVIGAILWIPVMVILGIILIVIALKIMWLLLKTYVMILLKIIVGPFYILLGTVTPGAGIGPWLKSIAADLSIYPIVGFMFILSIVFLRSTWPATGACDLYCLSRGGSIPDLIVLEIDDFMSRANPWGITSTFSGTVWSPPLTLFAGSLGGIINLAVSFVIITLIPQVANVIKSMIEKRPFAMGTAIGQAFGPGIGSARWAAGKAAGQYDYKTQRSLADAQHRAELESLRRRSGTASEVAATRKAYRVQKSRDRFGRIKQSVGL